MTEKVKAVIPIMAAAVGMLHEVRWKCKCTTVYQAHNTFCPGCGSYDHAKKLVVPFEAKVSFGRHGFRALRDYRSGAG